VLKNYIKQLFQTYQSGAREESYYPALKSFLEEFSKSTRKKKIDITVLPKKTEAGNPDFRIWDGKQKIVGYIEAKDLGKNLDDIEETEQLKRYLSTFPNVILTNFTEFRLYRDGEMIDKVSITRPFIIKRLSTVPPLENEDKLAALLERFLDFSLPKKFTAKTLAVELAKRTKFLKDEIVAEELKAGTTSIHAFYEAFQKFLIAGIDEDEFADLYSQTITYGLFAARLRAGEDFNRTLAFSYIPKSIGILRDIFRFISMEDIPKQMEIIIDDIAEVLSCADAKKILDQYYHEGKGSDPVLHFYETFLSEYDPATREKRGVYYTPEPVVSFIVRSLHQILKDKFNLHDGLASKNVTLLDPAGGTLGFIYQAIEVAVNEFKEKYGEGTVTGFLKDQVLKNFYAFELMMAPYAIGHMKISFLLDELGYTMKDDERVKYYLTNTLDMHELEKISFPIMSSLSEENKEAIKVKREAPILVILGNPPYQGISANKSEEEFSIKKDSTYISGYEIISSMENGNKKYGLRVLQKKANKNLFVKQKTWIGEQIEHYKIIDGAWFGERKHWLNNDYVKFIRFAQWKIDQAGEGVLGFITDNSYLDNITFRGMRQSLMNSFNEIYILDLHGNSNKGDKAPDGSRDQNVFDIMQGVSIVFFIKYKDKVESKILHNEIFGLRLEKNDWLNNHSIRDITWQQLKPLSPNYFFIPRDEKHSKGYNKFLSMLEIFSMNVSGIVTARDNLAIDIDKNSLLRKLEIFRNKEYDNEFLHNSLKITENYDWKIEEQKAEFLKIKNWKDYFQEIKYRPFDTRNIYYQDNIVFRMRKDLMQHMLQANIGIHTCRQTVSENWVHALVSNGLTDDCYVSNKTKERGYLFPLFLYPDKQVKRKNSLTQMIMFEPEIGYQTKQPNIKKEIFEQLKNNFNKTVKPEEIFNYIYAILYSNTYRQKYFEFLKIDFPSIPFTKDYKLFIKLGKLGKELADLHLLNIRHTIKIVAKYPIKGDHKVEKVKYEDEKVWINKEQYFSKVKPEVWEYQIGGYQVCEKWLKDRKNRTLNVDDIETYCQIVTALSKTIELQKEIDENYEGVEK
jgi:predicted helicase